MSFHLPHPFGCAILEDISIRLRRGHFYSVTTERKKVLDDTDQSNANFLTSTSNAKLNDLEYVLAEFGGKQPTFEEFYNKKIVERVVGLVSRAEEETGRKGLLDACKSKGLEQMLQVPSVALAERYK